MAKSTEAEVLKRVEQCIDLLLAGWMPRDIFRYTSEQAELKEQGKKHDANFLWDVTQRMIENYCATATKVLADQKTMTAKEAFDLSLAKWQTLYRKALASGDFANARMIQKEIDRLERNHDHDPRENDGPQDDGERTEFVLPTGQKISL